MLHISEYYVLVNDFEKAYENHMKFYEIEKELINDNNLLQISKIMGENEFKEVKKEIEVKNRIKDIEIREAKNKLYIFITTTFAIFILVIVLVIFFIKKQKAYKKLLEKQLEIEDAEDKIESVLKPNINMDDNSKLIIKRMIYLLEKKEVFVNPDFNRTIFAGMLGISIFKLSYIIKENWGMNYAGFVNKYRIRKALTYLENPETAKFSLNTIAESVGFKNGSNLTIAFKNHTGVSPSYYRKNMTKIKMLNKKK